jgi:hypothetical protein
MKWKQHLSCFTDKGARRHSKEKKVLRGRRISKLITAPHLFFALSSNFISLGNEMIEN